MRFAWMVATCAAVFVNAGCGGGGKDGKSSSQPGTEDKKAPAAKLVKVDLSSLGLPLTIDAPEGAVAVKEFGANVVKLRETFELSIEDGKRDVAAWKKELQESKVSPVKEFFVDTPATLYYSFAVGGDPKTMSHVFFLNTSVAGKDYHVSSRGAHINSTRKKESADLAFKCAQTLAPK